MASKSLKHAPVVGTGCNEFHGTISRQKKHACSAISRQSWPENTLHQNLPRAWVIHKIRQDHFLPLHDVPLWNLPSLHQTTLHSPLPLSIPLPLLPSRTTHPLGDLVSTILRPVQRRDVLGGWCCDHPRFYTDI